MSRFTAVSQKIETEDCRNPYRDSESADDEDTEDSMDLTMDMAKEKVDVSEFLKLQYTTFKTTGIIPSTITEEEFCGLTLENLTMKCCKFGLSETFEKMLLAVLSGNMLKKTDEESLIEVPLKDKNYYFNQPYLTNCNVKPYICSNRRNVLYLVKDNKIFKRLVPVKSFTKDRKVVLKFDDNMVFTNPITYNQIVALTGPVKERPDEGRGLIFDKDTKTWNWQISNQNFLKALRKYHFGKYFVTFTNLYFARDSGKPYFLDNGNYCEYPEIGGKYVFPSLVTEEGKVGTKNKKQNVNKEVVREVIYKKVVEDFTKNKYSELC